MSGRAGEQQEWGFYSQASGLEIMARKIREQCQVEDQRIAGMNPVKETNRVSACAFWMRPLPERHVGHSTGSWGAAGPHLGQAVGHITRVHEGQNWRSEAFWARLTAQLVAASPRQLVSTGKQNLSRTFQVPTALYPDQHSLPTYTVPSLGKGNAD